MSRLSLLTVFLISLLPSLLCAATIQIGDSYNDVILALGEPDGTLSAGSKQILTYGTAQVTIRDNKVSSISKDFDRLMDKRATEQDDIASKRKANLVNHRGEWITPEERDKRVRAQNQKRNINTSNASDSGIWMTDFKQAASLAQAQNKQLLMNFTGSDWCGWCVKLDREVFSQPEFMNYARAHYVMLKLDFPKGKKQDPRLKQQNDALLKRYRVTGFPTIIVIEPTGKIYKVGGYVSGGPKAFLQSIR